MSDEPESLADVCDKYGGGIVAFSLLVYSMIPAGLALFLYTFDPFWLLLCLPILLFL